MRCVAFYWLRLEERFTVAYENSSTFCIVNQHFGRNWGSLFFCLNSLLTMYLLSYQHKLRELLRVRGRWRYKGLVWQIKQAGGYKDNKICNFNNLLDNAWIFILECNELKNLITLVWDHEILDIYMAIKQI